MEQTKGDETDSELSSNWADLTHECLINILSRLTLEDRWSRAMFVCKSWMHASQDPCLNSAFDLEPYFGSAPELSRWWTPEFERKIDSMLRSVVIWSDGSLTEIRVRHCSDRSLALAAERCPKLEVLSIRSSANITDESISKIATQCPNLREVDVSYCYEVSHEALALLGKSCPDLKILKRNLMNRLDPSEYRGVVPEAYLDACPQDGDSDAAAVANSMPNLLHLELRFSKLSAKGLALVSNGCILLEYLDLYGCTDVTSRDIANVSSSLKNLKDIKKPNFYIPRSVYHTERYGHWQLYDERFQTDIFRI